MFVSLEHDNTESPSTYKDAAYKAWRTIRNRQRAHSSYGARALEAFVAPSQVTRIEHPEATSTPDTEPTLSFGKGIISQFHKTPADIACGKFWELRWAYGCPLDCNYCYLRGTMRGNMKPRIIKTEYVMSALDQAFSSIKTPSIFNSGELSDSLMNPAVMAQVADKFETQSKHKLSTLSKFGPKNVEPFVSKPRKQTICAWSVNAIEVTRRWERAAAPPDKRIEAAKLVSEAGYDTRIRLDPIFPIEDWKTHYEDVVYRIFEALVPRRIIMGTPRGLWKTLEYAQKAGLKMDWADYFKEDSSWGKKLEFTRRQEIYEYFYDKLQSIGYD
ncbi:MAG: spore photoproduct lyase family protein, partial [Nitrososphaerales archaeon]